MTKIRLTTDGGFNIPEVVGKVVEAEKLLGFGGYDVKLSDLIALGVRPDIWDDVNATLYFYIEEIEVITHG